MLTAAGSVPGAARTGLAANSTPPCPSLPPRDWSSPNPTVPYPDANVQVRDLRFKKYIAGTTLLRRVSTGALRAPTGFYVALCSMRSRRTSCWFIREIKASGAYDAARRRTGRQ